MVEKYIDSRGTRIWTASQGSGIPLLLCNGGPGCCDYLQPVAAMLEDFAYVIRFEQRGCGRSDQSGPYNVETCIADMEAIRESYGLSRWVVGGHSWGANLAIAYSIAHANRVMGIIGISGGVIHKDRAWSNQYTRLKDQETVPDFLYPPNLEVNEQVNESWSGFVRKPDLLRVVADTSIPAILICGERDVRPSWPIQQLATLLPRGKFVSIHGAEHAIWLLRPNELARHLRDFIALIAEKTAHL